MLALDAGLYDEFHYRETGPPCASCGGPILSDEGMIVTGNGLLHSSCDQTFRHQLRSWGGHTKKRPVGGLVEESVATI